MAVQLVVSVSDQGAVSVQGPIDDMLLSYGLLELARDAIQRHNAQKQAAAIRPPTEAESRILSLTPKVQ